jgi:hypothetical protein
MTKSKALYKHKEVRFAEYQLKFSIPLCMMGIGIIITSLLYNFKSDFCVPYMLAGAIIAGLALHMRDHAFKKLDEID